MRNRLIHILILSLLAVACSKEQGVPSDSDSEMSYLNISTRTNGTEDDFVDGSTLRLAVYDSGKETIHLVENLNYIYTVMSNSRWLYSYDAGETTNEAFGYLKNDTEQIDIVAVYPYIEDEDLSKVTIDVSEKQKPYMCATSKAIPLNTDKMNVKLDFKHIMTAFNFDMKLKNNVNYVTLSYINLRVLNSGGYPIVSLPLNATIDFTNSVIIVNEKVSGIMFPADPDNRMFLPNSDGDYVLKYGLYLPPFAMAADDVLEISFWLNGVKPTINNAIKISGATLNNEKAEDMKGVRYTLPIEIGNYLKFSGSITKEKQWAVADTIKVEL